MIHKVTAECIKSFRVLLSNEAHGLGVVGLNWTGSMTCGSFDVSVIGTDTLKYKMAQTHTHMRVYTLTVLIETGEIS